MGKVLNKAASDHMKKFGLYLEIKTNCTGRTEWQNVIRKAAGEKIQIFSKTQRDHLAKERKVPSDGQAGGASTQACSRTVAWHIWIFK